MRILVACEYSGRVRDAFRARGHDAISCDLEPSDAPGPHIQGDVLPLLQKPWDMLIAFPPCTYLSVSGIHWNTRRPARAAKTDEAAEFFLAFANSGIPKIAIENPVGVMSTRYRTPDQVIQPWQFGEDASKRTCLWLYNLPLLRPTRVIIKDRYANQTPTGQNNLGPSPHRAKVRSLTYQGIADAMASQWG
jgi:hypothetical protein